MSCKCCVPRCRGNYTVDTKVHVFKFPKNEKLQNAWIRAVPRENLVVTENSRVRFFSFSYRIVVNIAKGNPKYFCYTRVNGSQAALKYVTHSRVYSLEVKFISRYANFTSVMKTLIREAWHTDEATGRTIKVPLSHVRLRPDAVPSKFPNCPSYLSREETSREDPDSKRLRMEHTAMQRAIAESNDMFNRENEEDKVRSLSDLTNHLHSQEIKFWHAMEKNEILILVHIVDDEAPWLKYSVCVTGDLSVTLHVMKTAVKKLGQIRVFQKWLTAKWHNHISRRNREVGR